MSMTAGEIIWKITGDKSGLDKSLKKSEKSAKGFGKTMKTIGKTIGIAFAIAKVSQFMKYIVKSASDATEVGQKFGVVFKGITKDANKMAKDIANNYGISRTESKKLLSDTGDLLTGFNMSKEQALELSGQVQELAGDLASFNNIEGGTTEASKRLTKGLFGETEGMKSLGIVINQNSKEFKDSVKHMVNVEGKTLLQAKAMTILKMATSQSKNAIGDFSRSQGSLVNIQQKLDARFKDTSADLGKKLEPALKRLGALLLVVAKDGGPLTKLLFGLANGTAMFINGLVCIAGLLGLWSNKARQLEIDNEKFLNEEKFQDWKEAAIKNFGKVGETFFQTLTRMKKVAKEGDIFDPTAQIKAKEAMDDLKDINGELANLNTEYNKLEKNSLDITEIIQDTAKTQKEVDKAADERTKQRKKELDRIEKDNGKDNGKDKGILDSKAALYAEIEMSKISSFQRIEDEENAYADRADALLDRKLLTAKEHEDALLKIKENASEKWSQAMANQVSEIAGHYSAGLSQIGDLFSAIDELQQNLTQNKIADLDIQMERELEAAGLASDSKEEELLNDISRAERLGDTETASEKKKALERLKIEQKYAKMKAKLEYQAALMSWKMKLTMAVATLPIMVMNAYSSGAAIPLIGGVMGPIYAALAGVAGAVQIAAVAAGRPKAPSFQTGGIVPGSQIAGDSVAAQVNSGELILNGAQQKRLFDIADGRSSGGKTNITIYLGDEMIYKNIYEATKNGELIIDSRSLVSV